MRICLGCLCVTLAEVCPACAHAWVCYSRESLERWIADSRAVNKDRAREGLPMLAGGERQLRMFGGRAR